MRQGAGMLQGAGVPESSVQRAFPDPASRACVTFSQDPASGANLSVPCGSCLQKLWTEFGPQAEVAVALLRTPLSQEQKHKWGLSGETGPTPFQHRTPRRSRILRLKWPL